MTPVFRLEYFITAAANGTPCDLEPIFNEEKYLHAIAGASVDLPMPVGRTQEYLAKLAGMDVEIPDHPIFRTEYYLAHMIDSTVECPAPIFREEMFYYEWASNEYVTITGNPVSFTALSAPLRKLQIAFSPVQSLNGYDAPWPAGGGANKWDEEWEVGAIDVNTGENTNVGYTIRSKGFIPVTGGSTYYCYTHSINSRFVFYDANKAYMSASDTVNNATLTVPQNCAFVRFFMGSAYGTTYNHDIAINYPSSVTTYSPYSNICPISGWSSLGVELRGKNLLTAESFQAGLANITIGDDIDSITASTRYIHSCIIPARNGVAFSIKSHDLAKVNFFSVNRYVGRKLVDRAVLTLSDTDTHTNIYAANLYDYVRINIGAPSDVVVDFANADVQLELGTTVTPYEAGTGRSISISLGDTYYSGWVDVCTGGGEITHEKHKVSEYSWLKYNSGQNTFYATIAAKKPQNGGVISDSYAFTTASVSGMPDMSVRGYANNGNVYIKDSTYADKDEFMAGAANVELCFELATPIPIQLTPQEVQSLAGDNTMWTDGDSLTVEYRSN